ncbi:hypothetical protein [Variovorax sp. LT1R16]|uniref:hypothetical protein n=1 Tax=Variovorax sp. LT1R16 TaxID=3443728 RepID=UPI003F4559B7
MQEDAIDFRTPSPFKPVNTFSHLRLSEVRSLAEVLACLDDLHRRQPGHRFLCTLDDLDQCCYTSMHAREDERLTPDDEGADEDLDYDDPVALHGHEARQLAHVAAQLDVPALRQDWRALAEARLSSQDDVDALLAMNRDPDRLLAHDDVVYVQRVPVARDDLLIAGLPNGYFSADWNVFQNHALIRHIATTHGYRFFGIGASWLGFVRTQAPDEAEARRLVDDLSLVYPSDDAAAAAVAWDALALLLTGCNTLLLGYTENFAD